MGESNCTAAPETCCQKLESGATTEVLRQTIAEGGDLGNTEIEGATRDVVRWDNVSFDVVVSVVRA